MESQGHGEPHKETGEELKGKQIVFSGDVTHVYVGGVYDSANFDRLHFNNQPGTIRAIKVNGSALNPTHEAAIGFRIFREGDSLTVSGLLDLEDSTWRIIEPEEG